MTSEHLIFDPNMENITFTEGFKMTELGPLPEDWEVVRLGDYCRLFSGYAFKSSDFVDSGILVVKIGNLQNGRIIIDKRTSYFPSQKVTKQIEKYKLCKGDVLIALTGATTGKIAVVPKEFEGSLLNQRVGKFEIFKKDLDKGFFRYLCLLSFFQKKIKENILQSAQGNISPKQIEQIPIPLPPLSEQKAIAEVLKTIQDAIEATEGVIAAAKELKKSLMRHLFTYGPVPVSARDRVRLKETEIGLIPEDWEVVRLGEVVREKITDGTHKTPNYTEQGVPFITATNLKNGKIDFLNCKFISEQKHKQLVKRCKPEYGDLLLSKVGTLGLVAKVDTNIEFSIFVQLALIKPQFEVIDSEFLKSILSSEKIQNQIILKSSQSTMKYIGVAKIANLQIPLPPLPIQQKIAQILKAVDDKIEAEEKKKEALQAFFKTMLYHLMTGKIRLPEVFVARFKNSHPERTYHDGRAVS